MIKIDKKKFSIINQNKILACSMSARVSDMIKRMKHAHTGNDFIDVYSGCTSKCMHLVLRASQQLYFLYHWAINPYPIPQHLLEQSAQYKCTFMLSVVTDNEGRRIRGELQTKTVSWAVWGHSNHCHCPTAHLFWPKLQPLPQVYRL